jgi:hypothetical protein
MHQNAPFCMGLDIIEEFALWCPGHPPAQAGSSLPEARDWPRLGGC